jgi:glycosyltransferase involved in cell wall biosynthesis
LRVAVDLRLAGYRAGGIARYANELARALSQLPDLDVVPLLSRRSPARPGACRLWTPPHHRFERHVIGVELALRGVRPAVLHATDFVAPRLPAAVVATVHDLAFMRWPDDLTPEAFAYYEQLRVAQRWTAAWITPSRWTADELAACLDIDARAIHVVPHGAPDALLAAPVVPRDGRGDYVLAVGTVEPRKRYELLLDAWRGNAQLPRLIVVGAPGWRAETTQARLGATYGVEWRHDITDEQLRELYRHALAVLVPSRVEGFGLSALEALAAGTPVLSSGGGALPEVTGAVALTPHDTPDAWGEEVTRIRDDVELWQSLSTQGRERAAAFRWSRAASATAAVYRAAADSR